MNEIKTAFINKQDKIKGVILIGPNGNLKFAKEVLGYRCYFPGFEKYNFFAHKVYAAQGYCISELSTGMRIPALVCDGDSYSEALKMAAERLERMGLEKFTDLVNKTPAIKDRNIIPEI